MEEPIKRKRPPWVPLLKPFPSLGGTVKELREASPQAGS